MGARPVRIDSGPSPAASPRATRGFDFTAAARGVCESFCATLPEFAHVDMQRVAIGFAQTRHAGRGGMLASLTPLRFAGGARTERRRGRLYTVQAVVDAQGREQLYLLTFYLPRFLDLPCDEKLTTLAHELWHIGPEFDGDIRRHEGRCFAHSPSQHAFDEHARQLGQKWLAAQETAEIPEFLRCDFRALRAAHRLIYGTRYKRPKLVPVPPAWPDTH